MDPVTIAASVVSILAPFAKDAGKELVKTVGEVGVNKAKDLLAWLKQKFEGDPSAAKDLSRFQEDPHKFESGLKATIEEKSQKDPAFAAELKQRIDDIGPAITVFQDIAEGRLIVGGEGDVKAGRVAVNQKVQKADEVTGWKGNVGR